MKKTLIKRGAAGRGLAPDSAQERRENNQSDLLITKASGESEIFSAEKLRGSLMRSGADIDVVEEIVREISSWIVEGVTTRMIYDRAFQLLRKMTIGNAARYKLKKAMMELGPTGHPFEYFTGQIYKILGYDVEVGRVLEGLSVTHEMDVIATRTVTSELDLSLGGEKDKKAETGLRRCQIIGKLSDINCYLMHADADADAKSETLGELPFPRKHQHLVECKFYISTGKNANVQVPLYVRSRINDIVSLRLGQPEFEGYSFSGGIVTNTRFTEDAIAFGENSGLKLLSWDYPRGAGLREIIDREKIFPVTVLTRLTIAQKHQLMERGIVVCRQIAEDESVLDILGLEPGKRAKIIEEVRQVAAN
ncbi:MAG: ATP-binding protein [Bacteroidetes bacterium HGW-Bacteroidetes-10]|nr:MAG: ATP-binding protein [Bacteroidetes bacterium HGW-Bacteroidetes-10]